MSFDQSKSTSSSRSTSRSRSPMPPIRKLLTPAQAGLEGSEVADRNFLAALQVLIMIATDVLETSASTLISRPLACTHIIQKLQKVGTNWDDHDDWPGRSWYVDILMAIANLSRVLDWWEAEKGFWNFDEEDENESLMFVLKPAREESRFDQEFSVAVGEYRPSSENTAGVSGRMSAVTLDMPSPGTVDDQYSGRTATGLTTATPKAQAVEDLRFLAEHAKSVNIVMELSLQGEDIQYVNDAILEVVG
jgi:serine/threonine-protein kinase RIM15